LNPIDGETEAKDTYNYYIDSVIQFQKLFNYSGSIQSLLELPYCFFQDLIIAKLKDNVAEKDKVKNLKNKKFKKSTYGIDNKF